MRGSVGMVSPAKLRDRQVRVGLAVTGGNAGERRPAQGATFRALCNEPSPLTKAIIIQRKTHFSLVPYGFIWGNQEKWQAPSPGGHRPRTQPVLEAQGISWVRGNRKTKCW